MANLLNAYQKITDDGLSIGVAPLSSATPWVESVSTVNWIKGLCGGPADQIIQVNAGSGFIGFSVERDPTALLSHGIQIVGTTPGEAVRYINSTLINKIYDPQATIHGVAALDSSGLNVVRVVPHSDGEVLGFASQLAYSEISDVNVSRLMRFDAFALYLSSKLLFRSGENLNEAVVDDDVLGTNSKNRPQPGRLEMKLYAKRYSRHPDYVEGQMDRARRVFFPAGFPGCWAFNKSRELATESVGVAITLKSNRSVFCLESPFAAATDFAEQLMERVSEALVVTSMSSSDNGTRECPFCAETIRAKARLCRYCHSELDPTI